MTARTAHDVASTFDAGFGFAAFAIAGAIVEGRAARREADAALAEDYRAIAAQARLTAARAREAAAARHAEQAARRQAQDLAAAAQVAILRRRIAERASAA